VFFGRTWNGVAAAVAAVVKVAATRQGGDIGDGGAIAPCSGACPGLELIAEGRCWPRRKALRSRGARRRFQAQGPFSGVGRALM